MFYWKGRNDHPVAQLHVTKAAQQSVHWTGGYGAAFSSIFLASSFSCSQSESTPAHTQVTQTVGQAIEEI